MENNTTQSLSICIPTYNRKDPLIQLLREIEKIDDAFIKEIIISDNHSHYSISDFLSHDLFGRHFLDKCRVIQNNFNIGGQSNINNCFLFAKTKWLWIIGDDDSIETNCIDTIQHYTSQYPDCGWFKFSTANIGVFEDDIEMHSIHDFISYYHKKKSIQKGNLVFMSNNVYNMDVLKDFFIYAFKFSYTNISQIIPPLLGIDAQKIYVRYCSKSICKYNLPDAKNQWNALDIFLGAITISDLPFVSLSKTDQNKIKRIFTFWNFRGFAYWCYQTKQNKNNLHFIKKVFWNFFYPNISLIDYLIFIFLIIEIRFNIKLLSLVVTLAISIGRKKPTLSSQHQKTDNA